LALQAQHLKITVNGSPLQITEEMTVAALLQQLELDPALVAVERNLEIVPKSEYSTRKVVAGDSIEIVHFVGGG
jgi:thiamine biosynthesis protein ThiS